jgi:hypothetical protein
LTLRTRLWQFKLTWGTFQNALPVLKRSKNPSGFGVRWQAERDTALGNAKPAKRARLDKSAVAAALCRRSPRRRANFGAFSRTDQSVPVLTQTSRKNPVFRLQK